MLCPFSRSHPTGVRGLKSFRSPAADVRGAVAPHWGAWIEMLRSTGVWSAHSSHPTGVRGLKLHQRPIPKREERSHPTGVRGLKYDETAVLDEQPWSHPTGVRGLKYARADEAGEFAPVAPHWGAWIEITC